MNRWFLIRNLNKIKRRAEPRPGFARLLHADLVTKGYVPAKRPWYEWFARHITLVSTVVSMSAFSVTGAYAYVSDDVTPDHPLFPMRETIENVEEGVGASSPQLHARIQAHLHARRVKAALIMLAKDRPLKPIEVRFLRTHPDVKEIVTHEGFLRATRLMHRAASSTESVVNPINVSSTVNVSSTQDVRLNKDHREPRDHSRVRSFFRHILRRSND